MSPNHRHPLALLLSLLLVLALPLTSMADLHLESSSNTPTLIAAGLTASAHADSLDCGGTHCCTDICSVALVARSALKIPVPNALSVNLRVDLQPAPVRSLFKPPIYHPAL